MYFMIPAYLEFWPSFYSKAMLPFISNGRLFMIDHSPLYEFLPIHSTDDGRDGYPGNYHSYSDYGESSFSSESLPAGAEPRERSIHLVMKWLISPHPRPPCTCNIEV